MDATMIIQQRIAQVRIGPRQHYQHLTVFPLLAPAVGEMAVPLADALARGWAEVHEHASATVPSLLLINQGPQTLFILAGEEVVGGLQNRLVTTSALVRPGATVALPVICVEQGRWHSTSSAFAPGEAGHASLRALAAATVTANLNLTGERQADQHAIWEEVSRTRRLTGVTAPTDALNDIYRDRSSLLADYVRALPPVAGAGGLAVAVGRRLAALDLFGQPALAAAYWPRLVRSAALEAINRRGADEPAPLPPVAALLDMAAHAVTTPVPALDLGLEAHLAGERLTGVGLLHDGHVAHLALFPRPGQARRPTSGRIASPAERARDRRR